MSILAAKTGLFRLKGLELSPAFLSHCPRLVPEALGTRKRLPAFNLHRRRRHFSDFFKKLFLSYPSLKKPGAVGDSISQMQRCFNGVHLPSDLPEDIVGRDRHAVVVKDGNEL